MATTLMFKLKNSGVQKHQSQSKSSALLIYRGLRVASVGSDRMPEVRSVRPDLMRASGVNLDIGECPLGIPLSAPKLAARVIALSGDHGVSLAVAVRHHL